MEEQYKDELNDMLVKEMEEAAKKLVGTFDTIQIFCTREQNNETFTYHYGKGNYFARLGQVKTWVKVEDAANIALNVGGDE